MYFKTNKNLRSLVRRWTECYDCKTKSGFPISVYHDGEPTGDAEITTRNGSGIEWLNLKPEEAQDILETAERQYELEKY
jgi:hypothetical protein